MSLLKIRLPVDSKERIMLHPLAIVLLLTATPILAAEMKVQRDIDYAGTKNER